MATRILQIADGFWNIRGSFRIFGFVDIGTHCSLARRGDGSYVLLDSYTLDGPTLDAVRQQTDGGRAVSAILNLHPFHTIHVPAMRAQFPDARLYGTGRHQAKAPELGWEKVTTQDPAIHDLFGDDFRFTVPRGVDFVNANPALHFSSVLATHLPTRTLHVDDTLMYSSIPFMSGVTFHPTLKQMLERRPGAAADFRSWANELAASCDNIAQLCAAHVNNPPPGPLGDQVRGALAKVEKVLQAHSAAGG